MEATPDPSPRAGSRRGAPVPLLVSAVLVGAEAAVLVLQGVLEVVALDRARLVMGTTTALFFVLYGAALAYAGRMLARLKSWARAPVVVAQLIQFLVGWGFLGGTTTPVGVGMLAAALLVLAGIFHPASLEALAEDGG